MENDLIDNLHSFSSAINNLKINDMEIYQLIYFDNTYIEDDFLDRYKYFFQKELINADEKTINLILTNFDNAIKTNCGNDIDLNKYSINDIFGYKFNKNSDSGSLSKRYINIEHKPKDEILFKEMWLYRLIYNIKKIDSIIREVLNPIQPIKDNEIIELNSQPNNPYPAIFRDGAVYQAFIEYTSRHIIDYHPDFSYLKKRLEHEKLIHRHKDNDFMRIMCKEFKLISEENFVKYYIKKNKLSSLRKSYSVNRENNFNYIFSKCLN